MIIPLNCLINTWRKKGIKKFLSQNDYKVTNYSRKAEREEIRQWTRKYGWNAIYRRLGGVNYRIDYRAIAKWAGFKVIQIDNT